MSCTLWAGATTPDGYPRKLFRGNENTRWHRVVCAGKYSLDVDDIEGLTVRHTCDTPLCINPDHLVLGSVKDNVNDRTKRDRSHGIDMPTAREIHRLHSEGVYYKDLMQQFDCSRSTIYYTLQRVHLAGG